MRQGYNAYNMYKNYKNPERIPQNAAGKGLMGLLPWYSIGNSPSYQRQAGEAYKNLSGHGSVGGVSLQDLIFER
jgi:hypothetical protein